MRWLLLLVVSSLLLSPPASARASSLPNLCSLLTNAQLMPALGGSAQTHVAGGNRFYRTCTWMGPPMGYMQSRAQFIVSVNRESETQFLEHGYKDRPTPVPVSGLGTVAYAEFGGAFVIWKNGIELDLSGSYLSVYPVAGERLARSALKRL